MQRGHHCRSDARSGFSGQYAVVAVRDKGWRMTVAALAFATVAPLIFGAAVLTLSSGLLRVLLLILTVVGLLNILPFWPPMLRGDVDRLNEMIDRRRNL